MSLVKSLHKCGISNSQPWSLDFPESMEKCSFVYCFKTRLITMMSQPTILMLFCCKSCVVNIVAVVFIFLAVYIGLSSG